MAGLNEMKCNIKCNGNVAWRRSSIYGREMKRSEGSIAMCPLILSMPCSMWNMRTNLASSKHSRPSFKLGLD